MGSALAVAAPPEAAPAAAVTPEPPERCKGGKSKAFVSATAAEGWYGTLLAAQSGRCGRGCWPGCGCVMWIEEVWIEDVRRDERDDDVVDACTCQFPLLSSLNSQGSAARSA
jgi:hypothetical protein